MMKSSAITIYVLVRGERPDFRQVIAFLWSEDQDVDSDGDSYPASSRAWKELTLITRNEREERVDVDPCGDNPLVLHIAISEEIGYQAAPISMFGAEVQRPDVRVFRHTLYHEGEAVTRGRKYVLRSDIMFSL